MKPLELIEQGRFLGEEFLLWLWMRGMTEGGTSREAGDGSGLFVDDQIQLASERGEVKRISLAKGNPSECREAFEALSRGMRPVKLKVRILSGDLEWVATLDAAQLRLGALKMPPSTGKAPQERLHDRIFLLEEGHGHLDRRFKQFLAERTDDNGEALAQQLLAWVKAGLAGEALPAGEAPWQEVGPATGGFVDSKVHILGTDGGAEVFAKDRIRPLVKDKKSVLSAALDMTEAALQGVAEDPAVRRSMGKLMKSLAEHGTSMTITTPHDGRSVTITPEGAAQAAEALKGGR